MKAGDKVEINFDFGEHYTVEKIDVFLLLDYQVNNEMIQCCSVAEVDTTFLSNYDDVTEDHATIGSSASQSLGKESNSWFSIENSKK